MTTTRPTSQPLIWPSIARLLATFGIFIFHFQGLYGYSRYKLDFYAILIFCFLSGYLARIDKKARYKWLITRYFGIMVPYWLVIIPVFLANEIVEYKHISFFEYIVSFAGGNMFLHNPLYVIAWYVTFVLLLYLYVFIESFFRSYPLVVCMAVSFFIFSYFFGEGYYFVAFVIGLRLSGWYPAKDRVQDSLMYNISSWMFVCQRYCYSFFLIHGASILFFVKVVNSPSTTTFINSLFLSIVLSIVIYHIGKPISAIAADRMLRQVRLLEAS